MSDAVDEPDRVIRITELELMSDEERRRLADESFITDLGQVSPAMRASIEEFARVAIARRRRDQRRSLGE